MYNDRTCAYHYRRMGERKERSRAHITCFPARFFRRCCCCCRGTCAFAYSTILGWSYYGEKSIEYLFGLKAVKPYRYVFILFIGVGAIAKLDVVWTISDIFNGLMAFPNLIGLLALTPVVVSETKDYFSKLK